MGRRSSPNRRTFKKVLNFSEASFTAGFRGETIALGVDAIGAGQTTATDGNIPTGSRLKFFEIQMPVTNAVDQTAYINCSIQLGLGGQSVIDPDAVGGNTQRNQVFHQDLFSVGFNQNSTHKFKVKIPAKYQRMREGMFWSIVWSNSNSVNRRLQIVYKFEL